MFTLAWRGVARLHTGRQADPPQGGRPHQAGCKTIVLNRGALKPFVDQIGKKPLRELTAQDVRRVLTDIAAARSSRTVVVAHNAMERAIRHAEANDQVRRNVASLVRPPKGPPGRPSRSLTLDQAVTLMAAAEGSPLG